MNLTPPVSRDPFAPLVSGRIVVVAPSLRHVRALQNLLIGKIDQRPAVKLDDLVPETDTDILVFAQQPEPFKPTPKPVDGFNPARKRLFAQEGTLDLGGLSWREGFYTSDLFVVDDTRCVSTRDQTSMRYGDVAQEITSETVLAGFAAEFEKLD